MILSVFIFLKKDKKHSFRMRLPGDMAGRTDRAGISEAGEPVRMGGRMDRMPVAISSEIAPCRKQP